MVTDANLELDALKGARTCDSADGGHAPFFNQHDIHAPIITR